MIASSLKKSAIQAAIKGKTTHQLSTDGNANELLTKVKNEIMLLAMRKDIKKPKIMPPISEEEIPFEIPNNWLWVRLGEVSFNHGQVTPFCEFTYIDISSIDNLNNRLGNMTTMKPENAPSRARKIVVGGDVIYSTVRPYLHNICVIDNNINPSPIASTGFSVICTPFEILNIYLFYVFLSPMFDNYANDLENSKGVAYPAINDDKFQKSLIPLPPLAEQYRIVQQLKELLPNLEKLEKDEIKLDELQQQFSIQIKQSILHHAIQGKLTIQSLEDGNAKLLVDKIRTTRKKKINEEKDQNKTLFSAISEDEIPFEIPDNWCWIRLGEIVKIIGGTSYNKSQESSHGIRVIRGGNIIQGESELAIKDDDIFVDQVLFDFQKQIQLNDIIVVSSTGSKQVIGKAAIVKEEVENCQIGAFLRIIRSYSPEVVPYISLIFQSNYYRERIRDLISGTNIFNIKNDFFSSMPIPLPPLAEQIRIVEKNSAIQFVIQQIS